MDISFHTDRQIFRTNIVHPAKPPADEEALSGSKSADRFSTPELFTFLERVPSQEDSAQIRNVLSLGSRAINVQVSDGNVAIELINDFFRALLKLVRIFFGPPLFQIPFRIELAPLVVESVGDFMPDGA